MTEENKALPVIRSNDNTDLPETPRMQLDDQRRIKVLSPGMLVFKRFIRNRLAVIGLLILVFMFTFAFLGPFFSPYTQAQVFKGTESISKDYAGAIYNEELRYTVADGQTFSSADRAQFLLAQGKNQTTFKSGKRLFTFVTEGENVFRVLEMQAVAERLLKIFRPAPGTKLSAGFEEAFVAAIDAGQPSFDFEGVTYWVTVDAKLTKASIEKDVALAMLHVYDAYNQADSALVDSYEFKLISSRALANIQDQFEVGERRFSLVEEDGSFTVVDENAKEFAAISDIIVNPLDQAIFLTVPYKTAVRDTIVDRESRFVFNNEQGEPVTYDVVRVNTNYYIKTDTSSELIRTFDHPSAEHPLGLDNNGMDVMIRLMYGGRVSLLVGFVVIILETILGVVIGGISGYFGGWIDTALMRFVDLFNSIPFYPMVLIFGSVMDALEVEPMTRIFLLMAVLGILGWTGTARVVRGQILSLREQDFMVATEATGIRTSRKIFRHLVPNVMPLLIVSATAGLGGIIIAEATLGFLGLGVKYPLASWGSIINTASDAFVMTNFWFMWLPAGLLILLTVLGFNFVGDGLRDAYDPKMKR